MTLKLHALSILLIGLICLALGSALAAAQGDSSSPAPYECRGCHGMAYQLWLYSDHRLAVRNEAFQETWERKRRSPECFSCHATGYDPDSGTLEFRGVSCAACHAPIGNGEFDPNERDHAKMSIPEKAEDCAVCHEGDHALTYTEWKVSAHNAARQILCQDCHDAHSGELVTSDVDALCDSCHAQPIPSTNPHMGQEGGCSDCHPAPISKDNIHMRNTGEVVATCIECHMVTELDSRGQYLSNAGHTLKVPLAACVNCHGELHDLKSSPPSPDPYGGH